MASMGSISNHKYTAVDSSICCGKWVRLVYINVVLYGEYIHTCVCVCVHDDENENEAKAKEP